MANEPTGEFIGVRKINIILSKKDWCSYKGECKEGLNIKSLCWNCRWMNKFDIPALVGEILKNGNNDELE